MTECSIKSCVKSAKTSSYQKDGISFHRFPKCQKTRQKWIEATRRDDDWSPTNESVICSIHFTDDDFQVMKSRRRLRDNCVPTVNLPVVFSMDSSLRDFVIAEYKLKMQENNTGPTSTTTTEADDPHIKKEIDKKEIDVKSKQTKPKKSIKPIKHKYGVGAGRSMKFIQLLANEKLRKKKKRR